MPLTLSIPLPEKPRVVSREGDKAVFEISGLYPGYGVTLGNALRRVLLSSLPGAAVTTVMLQGASHEFTTIPGVQETVLDITLNLKKLRMKVFSDEPQVVTVKKKGEGVVTSDDLRVPAQVHVVSKGLTLATITDKKGELSMELTVERGLGYVPADVRQKEKMPIGSIALDAVFTPVRSANFTVENMRVGDRTDYNLLRLTLETDGTLDPEDALQQAAQILLNQFSVLVPAGASAEDVGAAAKALVREPLAVLGLSGRVVSALEHAGIRTVADLLRKSAGDLEALEGIGAKTVKEIVDALAGHNLALKE